MHEQRRTSESPTSSRQSPGAACEECRRRKLRCDRKQPQCGVCEEWGVVCIFNSSRPRRGPKKGHLRTLQNRIEALERRLVEKSSPRDDAPEDSAEDYTYESTTNKICLSEISAQMPIAICVSRPENTPPEPYPLASNEFDYFPAFPLTPMNTPEPLHTDLDQQYFENVHIFVPFIHQQTYISWAKDQNKSEPKKCLQYAMWTLAASMSMHFQYLGDPLYRATKDMLEVLERKNCKLDNIEIETAQAWILLALYELMRTCYRRGWLTAGRAFRIVQLMRLYDLDGPNCSRTVLQHNPTQERWIETEVKRKTFWMAYCLDRFLSVWNEWPLTINEHVISTRLPALELDFQNGTPVVVGFLSEVIATSESTMLSPFTENILLATIYGRSLSHKQQTMVEGVYGDLSETFWGRHQWLDNLLQKRIQVISVHSFLEPKISDSFAFFNNMMAHAIVLYLYSIIKSFSWVTVEDQVIINEHREQAQLAANEILDLAKKMSQLGYTKTHPFTPIPLFRCAEFFLSNKDLSETCEGHIQEASEVLYGLTRLNNIALNCVQVLEL